jgi:hypothetical protein
MPKKQGPEAKIISLFTALPEDSKRIVLEIIKSQQVRISKSQPAPSTGKQSRRNKSEDKSAASSETEKETATTAAVCAVPNCGQAESAPVHNPEVSGINYHVFHAAIKTRGAGAGSAEK